ncbi:MAG: FHA domain-containing protein, partial [Aggregatilineales bacterium]
RMIERKPRPGTTILGSGWQLMFTVDNKRAYIDVKDKITVGRDMQKDGSVDFDLNEFGAYHFGVSRHHANLNMIDSLIYLEDNNSTNGTRINGFQLTPHQQYRLRDGDELEFGRLRIKITFMKPGSQ